MKTLIFLLLLAFVAPAYSQSKMTDRESAGLLGPVKSVRLETKDVTDHSRRPSKANTVFGAQDGFAQDGSLTETLRADSGKIGFRTVDGAKTSVTIESPLPKSAAIISTFPTDREINEPIERPEVLTEPDARFDFKFTYDYDGQGRVIAERKFGNDGRLWILTKRTYAANGKVSEELQTTKRAMTKFTYTYNRKGQLIETREERDIRGAGVDSSVRTLHSAYVLDRKGNWIQRKSHEHYSDRGDPERKVAPGKWDRIYMEYRTITYY